MPSNINPYNVDGTFPVAGQDNSSQGFRDNFTNIKNNFLFAENEISDLQDKVLVTKALNGQVLDNDMAGTIIRRPQLAAWTQTLLLVPTTSGVAVLDFNSANFQKITTSGPITLSFQNWPTSVGSGSLGYGLMRIWVYVTDPSHTVTLPDAVNIGVNDIAGYNADTGAITFDAPGNYVFDFSSIDGGATYLIFDVTRNRSTFRDPNFYFNDQVNSTVLIGYGESALPMALALEQGADKVSVRGSYNSVAAGTDYMGNVHYTQNDNGPTAGYSITGFRGNIDTGTMLPVHDGDFLGYVNTLSLTGNTADATGNSVQSLSSIAFYARGASMTNGLGGNIALFTAPDGTGTQGFMRTKQAVGFEADQSAQFFGDVNIIGNLLVNGTSTTAGSSAVIVGNIGNIGDVNITSVTNNQTLVYNAATHKWVNSSVSVATYLANVGDVTVTNIANADFLRYDTTSSKWINTTYNGNKVSYAVTIGDNGSGSQNVFKFNGVVIKSNTGTTHPIVFKQNNLYKFDLSDSSNQYLGLGFSTTPDTADPASVTPYTTGVTQYGTPGSAGAYVTIQITDTTPSPLYFYGIETGVPDGSLLGGAVANYVQALNGGETIVSGNVVSLNSIGASNNITAGGQLFATGGMNATPIGNVTPSIAVFTTTSTAGLQARAIGNATPGTGNFTTLITAGLQATAIGNVAPGTGAFTTLSTTGTTTVGGNLIISGGYVPSTASSSGVTGQIAFDGTHIYVCVATNSWVRSTAAAW
jgi:hypothetical protein